LSHFIGLILLVIEEVGLQPRPNAGAGLSDRRSGGLSLPDGFESALSRSSFAAFSDTVNRRGSWLSENLNMLLMVIAMTAVVVIIGMAAYFGYTILMPPDIAAPDTSAPSAPISDEMEGE